MKKICVFLFYFLCAIIFTYPAIFHLKDMVIGDGGDGYEFLTYQYIVADNLKKGKLPLAYTNILRYPIGFYPGVADGRLFVLTGGLLNLFLKGVLAYNLLILLFFTINGFVSFLFFNKLIHSYRLGILGGLIYGFSYYTLSKGIGHPNLLPIFGFPLLGFFLIKTLERPKDLINYLYLMISVFIISLSSLQYFFICCSALLVFSLIGFFIYRKKCFAILYMFYKNKKIIILLLTSFLIIFFIFFKQYINAYLTGNFIYPTIDSFTTCKLLVSYFLPNNFIPTFLGTAFKNIIPASINNIESTLFLGFLEILLFIFFIIKPSKTLFEKFILLLTITFFIISLGIGIYKKGIILPYFFLSFIFPFKAVMETERFFVIFYLFLTSTILLLLKNSSRKMNFFTLIILLIIMERFTLNYPLSASLKAKYQDIVTKLPGEAVLDIPILLYGNNIWQKTVYNSLPFYYQKKITGGLLHQYADISLRKQFLDYSGAMNFFCQQDFSQNQDLLEKREIINNMLIVLKDNKVNIIVVHKEHLYKEECRNVNNLISLLPVNNTGLGKIYEDEEAMVFLLK